MEVDPELAEHARRALADAGFASLVVTGDGTLGYPQGAPFDRVIATASVREVVPAAWLGQLRSGGRLVTPWGYRLVERGHAHGGHRPDGTGTGRFSSRLAFMRLRDQRRALYGWEPEPAEIGARHDRHHGLSRERPRPMLKLRINCFDSFGTLYIGPCYGTAGSTRRRSA